ncbi:hypothetical protein BDV25DRAFT_171564 [Aspergillus avenaceus]|uniref:NACHT domain-containing protein n=1 Tax=Aspergillus avenaceus TaxID=36643 RepID=A0A5N6TYE7_ASPAV|nr:hypothetical protein BDV25DRAFT_171564 [Aspergillus avenaceus]
MAFYPSNNSGPSVAYTVSWICAITTESVAAQAFLDEKHEPIYALPNDSNSYTLGRMGRHNIVIAVLPEGEYGTTSAATTAVTMLNTFPNIRIGLLVGIGGGAPSPKNDVRLGDVVVSSPGGGNGGVFQYDFGKAVQGQIFEPTKHLNQPPRFLRTAVSKLRGDYLLDGHGLEARIENTLTNRPRLRKKFGRPSPDTDRLYHSNFIHPQNVEAKCQETCGHDPANLVFRNTRDEFDDGPLIHYGIIASANTLLKDASIRDALAREHDVLCLEMEAAGLMNDYPCLVIRGICDYADTHKNNEWQGSLKGRDIQAKALNTSRKVNEICDYQRSEVSKKILKWLTPVHHGSQQSDHFRSHQPGTGRWLLDSNEYRIWININRQNTFCSGIPGGGKTILTSVVVEDLYNMVQNGEDVAIAYVYFNYRQKEQQTPEHILKSLLKQLVQPKDFPIALRELHTRHCERKTQPTLEEVSKVLESVVPMYSKVFLVLDALDECSQDARKVFLRELFSIQSNSNVKIFATSRLDDEIKSLFSGAICLTIQASDHDIQTYLNQQMSLHNPNIFDGHIRSMVIDEITKRAEGMFLLAVLHITTLIGLPTKGDVKNALQSLATGIEELDETYRLAMMRIADQGEGYRILGKKILGWVVHAKRPLCTEELLHALAIRPDMPGLDKGFVPELDTVMSVCAGLVTADKESNIIRLVHYTTQEYFKRTHSTWFPNAEADIAIACATYLSFNIFQTGVCQTPDELQQRRKDFHLYDYAANHWARHSHKYSTQTHPAILKLLKCESKLAACSQAMTSFFLERRYGDEVNIETKGPHGAAHYGLEGSMAVLLDAAYETDCKDAHGHTPLHFAAECGNVAMVTWLLERDADPNNKSKFGDTPLLSADDYDAVVKLLLDKGADPNCGANTNATLLTCGSTPLHLAASNGFTDVVKLLLGKGADPNFRRFKTGTMSLHQALMPLVSCCWQAKAKLYRLCLGTLLQ